MHLDLDDTVSTAGFTAAALHIEAETSLLVAPGSGIRRSRKQIPDLVEHPGIGGRIGAGRSADGRLVDGNDLVQLLHAHDIRMLARDRPGPIQLFGQPFVQNLIDQGAFSRTGHAGDTSQHAQWKIHIYIFQIIFLRALYRQPACGCPSRLGHRDLHPAAQVSAGDGILIFHDILGSARCHHLAAVLPGPRPDIHNIIRRPHGVLVMLHHQNGVSQIPQMLQRVQQLVVVPLMQADAGLIQNIGNPHQAGTDLGCQPDPLGFPAGQRAGGPGKAQIVQSHVHEEAHPGPDLLQYLMADELLLLRQLHLLQKGLQLRDGQGSHLINILIAYRHRQGRFFQTLTLTCLTGRDPHKRLILLLHDIGARLPIPAVHVLDQSFERHIINAFAPLAFVVYLQHPAVRSVQEYPADLLRQLLIGRIQRKMIGFGHGVQNGVGKTALIGTGLPPQHCHRPTGNGQALIRDHQILVKLHLVSQAKAVRAGTEGIVEGKASGLDLLHTDAAVRTGKALAERHGFPADDIHDDQTIRQRHDIFQRVRQPLPDPILYHQTIHDDLDVVFFIFIQGDILGQLIQIAVHPHAHIAALPCLLKQLHVLALASPHHRRQQLDLRPLRQLHDLIRHLIHTLLADLPAAFRAVGNADPGIQQTEIIVNLCHRAHGRTGVAVRGLLINGNGRGKPFDALHVRLLHLPQELSRVGRQ